MSGHNWYRKRTLVFQPAQPRTEPRVRRFRVGHILWQALKRTAMVFGFLFLFSMLITFIAASRIGAQKAPALPDQMVMLLDTTGEMRDQSKSSQYLAQFGLLDATGLSVPGMVDAIDAGRRDDRVKALALLLGAGEFELTDYQELRAAVLRFREAGKPVYAYASSYGGGGSGLGMYYLASAANQIWMQPVGVVSIPGMNAQLPFLRGLLDKAGVQPQFFQRKEFKTAMEHFTSYEMSSQSREQMEGLIEDIGGQFVSDISVSRKELKRPFASLIDHGLFTDSEALEAGLVDKIDYRDVFVGAVREAVKGDAADKKPDFVTLEDYTASSKNRTADHSGSKHLPRIARISVNGMIVEGAGSVGPYGLDAEFARASVVANAITQAAEDSTIKAILLRINSPGGTPTAAETIHRAIVRAKVISGKPIIVSMGNAAASGGYWIAAPADRIYALPSTLTGSIGVVGGKFDVSGLWQKLDVKWQAVPYGRNSGMWSFNQPFSPSEQERFEASLDSVYTAFIKRVVDGRKLTTAQAEEVARGHVWTGRQALALGLVDALGGEDKALDDLAVTLKANDRSGLQVVDLPKRETPLEAVVKMLEMQSSLPDFLPRMAALLAVPVLVKDDARLVYDPVFVE